MNRNARLLLILPLLLFVSACIDRDPMDPNVVAGPQLAWVDAVDGFYFFSPIGSGVTGARLIGTQAPTVDVCPKTASVCDEATAIAHVTRTLPGTGNATMQLSPENAYQVDWNTQFTENSHNIALFPAVYVIVVRVGDEVLGTADIAFFTSIGQMKKANPNVFAVLKGRSLPIKFGITLEALIGVELATEDFVIKTFTTDNTVQTAVVPSEQAAFQVNGSNVIMPPGFEGSTEFTVVIYQKELTEAGECEPAYNGPQFGGCYVYETIPQGVTFYDGGGNAVGVGGVCPDLDVPEEARLAKFDEGVTTFPDEGPEIEELDCAEEIIGLHRLPRVLRGLARLALPRPLHAKDLGETGTMGAFSTLFWAPPYELAENPASPLPTDPLTAGAQLSLQFRVMSTHDDPLDPGPKPQSGV